MIASGLHFIVLWLGAGGTTDGRVGEIHVRGHRCRVCRASGLGVGEVIGRSGGGHAAMRRRGPPETGHVGTAVHTVGAMITVGRGLKGLRGGIGMRSHRGPSVGRTAVAGQRRGSCGGGSPRAALGEISANMRRNGTGAHVVVASGAVHVQRRKLSTRRHRCVLSR